MKTIIALLVGLALGCAAMWLLLTHRGDWSPRAFTRGNSTTNAASGRIAVSRLTPAEIKEELARTGQIVRRAATTAGRAVADATADTRATAAIKARFVTDANLSALRISVNCTEGRVTLSGTVSSMDDISRAMLLAMETEGVTEVVSTLQVRP